VWVTWLWVTLGVIHGFMPNYSLGECLQILEDEITARPLARAATVLLVLLMTGHQVAERVAHLLVLPEARVQEVPVEIVEQEALLEVGTGTAAAAATAGQQTVEAEAHLVAPKVDDGVEELADAVLAIALRIDQLALWTDAAAIQLQHLLLLHIALVLVLVGLTAAAAIVVVVVVGVVGLEAFGAEIGVEQMPLRWRITWVRFMTAVVESAAAAVCRVAAAVVGRMKVAAVREIWKENW
jgi:hypothetical protein